MKNRSLVKCFATIATLTAATSCKTTQKDNPARSNLSHVENELVRKGSESWQFTELSRNDFLRKALGIDMSENSDDPKKNTVFPESSLANQFLNYWISEIHKRLASVYPEQIGRVPAPKGVILASDNPNAMVTGVRLCFDDLNISLENSGVFLKARQGDEAASALTFGNGSRLGFTRFAAGTCVQKTRAEAAQIIPAIIAARQQRGVDQACPMRYSADEHKLRFDGICSELIGQVAGAGGIPHPESFHVFSPANWLTFYSGLFKLPYPENYPVAGYKDAGYKDFDKEQIISVIAHELAHYYRSHQTSFAADYNYYYWRNDFDRKQKPQSPPYDQLQRIQSELRKLSAYRSDSADPIPGAQLSGGEFSFLASMIKRAYGIRARSMQFNVDPLFRSSFGRPLSTCIAAYEYVDENGVNDYPFILRFPRVHPSSDEQNSGSNLSKDERIAIYLTAEEHIIDCANELPIQALVSERDGKTYYRGASDLIQSWTWAIERIPDDEPSEEDILKAREEIKERAGDNWQKFLTLANAADYDHLQSALQGALNNVQIKEDFPPSLIGQPLIVALNQVTKAAIKNSQKLQETITNIRKMNIGWYTIEEEADSIETEILARLGINPLASVAGSIKLFHYLDSNKMINRVLNPSLQECYDDMNNDWPLPPFLGSLSSIHHGSCYRIYNKDEEINAHGYNWQDQPRPQGVAASWKAILEDIEAREQAAAEI